MHKDWLAATQAGECGRVEALLKQGHDINSLDKHSQTALMNAAHWGNLDLVKLLVENGADLNCTAKYSLSALMLAVIGNHREIVKVLVEAGADTHIRGSKGSFACTPLEYAVNHGFNDIANHLRDDT